MKNAKNKYKLYYLKPPMKTASLSRKCISDNGNVHWSLNKPVYWLDASEAENKKSGLTSGAEWPQNKDLYKCDSAVQSIMHETTRF